MARRVLIPVISTLLLAAAITLLAVRPAGVASARRAAATHGSVIAAQDWGDGAITVSSRGDTLTLAFVRDSGRGWRVVTHTSQSATTSDVGLASLLVAESPGGDGQPAWTAAYGRVAESKVARVEISWKDGRPASTADVRGGAYLVLRRDVAKATQARFLDLGGAEIARVPI